MRTVDAGLVAMESIRGRSEPPRVCSFLRSLSNFKFTDRLKGRGGKQVSCVLARMRVPEPKEIHDHGVISKVGRSRQRNNIALISVFFFALIAYNLLRYATQHTLSEEPTHENASPSFFF